MTARVFFECTNRGAKIALSFKPGDVSPVLGVHCSGAAFPCGFTFVLLAPAPPFRRPWVDGDQKNASLSDHVRGIIRHKDLYNITAHFSRYIPQYTFSSFLEPEGQWNVVPTKWRLPKTLFTIVAICCNTVYFRCVTDPIEAYWSESISTSR